MDIKQVANQIEKEPEAKVELPASEEEFNKEPLDEELPETQETDTAKDAPAQKKEQEEPDYKALYEAEREKALASNKRYIASSKESRKLKATLKQLEAEKAKATTVQITDEELQKKYKDWNDYTSQEQNAIRRAENAERRAAMAEEVQKKYTQEDQFTQELDDFIDLAEAEGTFVDVRDQVDEFKRFARLPENRGKDVESLAKIFTFDHPKSVPVHKPSTPFGNSSRSQQASKPAKMTWQQKQALRKNDPRKYEAMLEKGLLD